MSNGVATFRSAFIGYDNAGTFCVKSPLFWTFPSSSPPSVTANRETTLSGNSLHELHG